MREAHGIKKLVPNLIEQCAHSPRRPGRCGLRTTNRELRLALSGYAPPRSAIPLAEEWKSFVLGCTRD